MFLPQQIRKDGDVVKGKMSTKGLSPTERLALQAGSVMEVRVMKADGSAYEVALPGALAETAKNAERNDRQSTNRSFKKPSITPAPSQQVQTEPPGLTLNGLKIGMKIDGTVINSTPYAVFIAASIYRPGKGGRYVEVNGMLHRNDMSKELRSKNKSGSMMANGTPVTAYVKEIFKNSG